MADENDARQQTMNAHINTVKDQLDYTMKNKNDAREWQREDVAYLISLAERAEQNRNVLTTSVSAKWLRDAAERVNNSLNAAAAVTQEREALRRTLKSRMMDYEPYIAPLREEQKHLDPNTPERAYWHYGYSSALADVLRQLEPRAAAEESQPK